MSGIYQALSEAFSYPWDKERLISSVEGIAGYLGKTGEENSLAGLREFISQSDLGRIQEDYISAFDLSPACAPYVGYHLYGDNHKKGEYMIKVKGVYREHGYRPPEDELPDHLAVMFDFVAGLSKRGADEERKEFLAAYMHQGLRKMQEVAAAKPHVPWRDLITAAGMICAADCEEVLSC